MSECKRGDCTQNPTYSARGSKMGGPDTSELISLKEVARRCSMSEKTVRNLIRNDALPHWRNSNSGKIWLRWTDVLAWLKRRRIELRHDDNLLGILRDMGKRAGVAQR